MQVAQQLFEKCVQKSSSQTKQGSLGGLYVGSLGPSVYLKWRMARLLMMNKCSDDDDNDVDVNNNKSTKAKQLLQEALSTVQRELELFEGNNNNDENAEDTSTNPLRRKYAWKRQGRRSFITLLEGSYVGCKAMSAVLHFDLHEQQQALHEAQQLVEVLQRACCTTTQNNDLSADECEVLYGRAGALQAILFVRDAFQQHDFASNVCLDVARSILHRGEQIATAAAAAAAAAPTSPSLPLLWVFHDSYYLGAAHGVVGILQMILSLNADELNTLRKEGWLEKVRSTIDGLDVYCFPSGNLDSSIKLERTHYRHPHDRLVQWCHGAPGHVMLLVKAATVFSNNDNYLTTAKRIALDVVWPRGLLYKGVGLCHGISGNAYAFLAIGREDEDDASFQSKAKYFANFALMHLAVLENVPDEPYSLYEGLSGLCCLAMDLSCPERARFPLYEF